MKQKSLLVTSLLIILALILFAMVGCEPVKHTKARYSYRPIHRQPRTYVQFDHYWYGNRPYIQPRIIVIQPKQPRQSIRQRGKR
jgi:hypothetical protein